MVSESHIFVASPVSFFTNCPLIKNALYSLANSPLAIVKYAVVL